MIAINSNKIFIVIVVENKARSLSNATMVRCDGMRICVIYDQNTGVR